MIRDPDIYVTNGYDIHVTFTKEQREAALLLYDPFLNYLKKNRIEYRNHKIFDSPVGPWTTPMWQVILSQSKCVHQDLGKCISWFMLNRGELSVMVHPNTKEKNGLGGGYEDHSQNMLWLGEPRTLKLHIFDKKN